MDTLNSLLYGLGELIWDAHIHSLIVLLGLAAVVMVTSIAICRSESDE